ncbi:uncharacterized protein BP5553_02188 [Venustampulla echinocandica]|uniref:Tc1-like transposase DDE domain-containing protein n=1 Tax=Venustampulla echinocandica TaxID=2656787 RepID=A0A370U354_9HELO|nr:uncharacterized protein BP5553_02188 [Venustampulla echinocandica]RDL42209.1 hypothetical protein BP5553_02188 [Venustampulla echinocandica]
MAPTLPKWKTDKIDQLLSAGASHRDFRAIAAEYKTTYKTICERYRRLEASKVIGNTLARPRGPTPVINHEIQMFLVDILEREPNLYLDEMADYIYAEFEIKVTITQVSRAVKRLKQTNKLIPVSAGQRNRELVLAYQRRMVFWDPRRICFVDESAYNERTASRRREWAPYGAPANIKRLLTRSDRWSILPAYTIDGYMEQIIYQGSITTEIFENWLANLVLPKCVARGINILIMDNASIHRNERVKELCTAWGVQLECLPPYCPFLNPMEESFADIKNYLRKNWKWSEQGYEDFEGALIEALKSVGRGPEAAKRARGYFRHSGYEGVPTSPSERS